MSDVLHMLPRVVHPSYVQRHDIYVNGRDWHYLCGVIATENLDSKDGQGGSLTDVDAITLLWSSSCMHLL
jgi:hypothetical protein